MKDQKAGESPEGQKIREGEKKTAEGHESERG